MSAVFCVLQLRIAVFRQYPMAKLTRGVVQYKETVHYTCNTGYQMFRTSNAVCIGTVSPIPQCRSKSRTKQFQVQNQHNYLWAP